MEAIAASGAAEIAAIADPSAEAIASARGSAPDALVAESLDALLDLDLDGVVLATPSALHAEQSITALERGVAVFCQKPLARTADETERVVAAAREADRLLGVDLSYRYTEGMQRVRELVQTGALGQVYAIDLVFHNAYGPDKAWFHDPALSGGGCVTDLGVHLVDLALWTLDFPGLAGATSRLYRQGQPLGPEPGVCEDFAVARLDLEGGTCARLACSWNLSAGVDAVIEATFYGAKGSARLRNVGGSFFDFAADHLVGTQTHQLTAPPDAWGGRAAVQWARQLGAGARFDASAEHLVDVARALDAIYGRGALVERDVLAGTVAESAG